MHYNRYELDQYRTRAMRRLQRLCCKLHLAHCPLCREELAQLEQDDWLIAELRNSRRNLSVAPDPGEYRRLCALFHDDAGKRKSTV